MKVNKQCQNCGTEFLADTREINRGNAKYCSLQCSGAKSKSNMIPYNLVCKHCGRDFKSKVISTKYCSLSCKQKHYRLKSQNSTTSMKVLYNKLQHLPCQICGWKEATRDIHHIKPVSQGGTNIEENLIVVCPNHHRMIHSKLISETELLNYKNL